MFKWIALGLLLLGVLMLIVLPLVGVDPAGVTEYGRGYKAGQAEVWEARKQIGGGFTGLIFDSMQIRVTQPNRSVEWNRGYNKGQKDAYNNR